MECENIQKRDFPSGPSFKNSCPKPSPHFPQETWNKAQVLPYLISHY